MPDAKVNFLVGLKDKGSGELLSTLQRIDKNTQNLAKSNRRLQKATQSTSAAFRQLRNVFIALGVAKVIKDTVQAAVNFEDAFAGVRKTVEATEEEFQALNKGLIQMSRTIPIAATDLARIQELAGQLGVEGVDNLSKFTETIAKISVTTNLTTESASTDFARIANIMQTPIREVDRMGSAVVDLGNNFATTEAEIVNFANRIAGAGKVVGLTEADILAFGTAFSSVGVRAERGGTAVSKALIMMTQAIEDGGTQLRQFAKIAGLTADEFARSFRDNAGKTFALFIEGLGKAGDEGGKILQELQLGDQRLIQAFLSVGGATGILTEAIEKANKAYEENNALNEEAEKRFDTSASKIQLIKNNITALQIEIGNKLLPAFEKLLRITVRWVDYLSGEDLKLTDLQIYQKALEDVNEQIEKRNSALFANKRFFDKEFNRQTEMLERQRDVLRDMIQQEELRTSPKNEQFREENISRIAEKYAHLQETIEQVTPATENVTKQIQFDFENMFDASTKEGEKFVKSLSQGLASVAVSMQTFSEFWDSLWKSMAFTIIEEVVNKALQEVITKLTFIKTLSAGLGGLFGGVFGFVGGLFKHDGGMIEKAHDGKFVRAHNGLAVDEVPIIAQTGEGILSRKGMAALGGEGQLQRLNAGQSAQSSSINITINSPNFKSRQDMSDLVNQIGFQIDKELRYPR